MFERAYNDYSKLDKHLDDFYDAVLFASTTVVIIIWTVVSTFCI